MSGTSLAAVAQIAALVAFLAAGLAAERAGSG
jgi:hypothetical protein